MAPRVARHVVTAGIVGCAAALYYQAASGRGHEEAARTRDERETSVGSAPSPGQAWPRSSKSSGPATSGSAKGWSKDKGQEPNEDPLAVAIAIHHNKGVRQRMKDSINRRRAQHKFPYNNWWKWKRRRHDLEDTGELPDLPGRRMDGAAGADGVLVGSRGGTGPGRLPSTSEVAGAYAHVIDDIKLVAATLLKQDAALKPRCDDRLAPRFDDLEITRYAIHYGLLRIDRRDALDRSSDGYRMVVQDAAEGIINSQEWFSQHKFASIEDLHKDELSTLVRWEFTPGKDARPTLHVDVGRAVAVCVNKTKQQEFANIVLTMMELASLNSPLTGLARLPPGGIDRIDVAIYAHGTNTMNAKNAFWILRSVVRTVSHHYPGRLNTLVLHDLPLLLNWVVLGVKRLVHPDTAKKFVVM